MKMVVEVEPAVNTPENKANVNDVFMAAQEAMMAFRSASSYAGVKSRSSRVT
jgi:hypothetical protein